MKTAVVIPSMRGPKCLESFLKIAPQNVDFIIISEQKLEKKYDRTTEFNDKEVFEKSWIFNRHTKRNFGFAYALRQNYDVVINLDDDCFPKSDSYFDDHIKRLQMLSHDHFNILNAFSNIPADVFFNGARGHPTDIAKKLPIVVNQGLWEGDLDLPSITICNVLSSKDGKIPKPICNESKVVRDFVVPKNQFTTVCGMNTSFLKEVIPAFPYTYQEPDDFGIARYDDIWSGLFIKKILDKLDKRMSAGFPVVSHEKGLRDVSIDGRFEAKGDTMNSFLWNNLSELNLETNDYTSCFLEIADWLDKTSKNDNSLKFFEKVAESMYGWIKFLDSKF